MEMINVTINGTQVSAPAGSTILEAARLANIEIPTLCYLKEINEIGACRICVVEVKGAKSLVTSCVYPISEGMEIWTNTPKVLASRKKTLQLILSDHDRKCLSCVRSGNCELQKLCHDYKVDDETLYDGARNTYALDESAAHMVRDNNKCILCRRCTAVCEKVQGIGVIGANERGFSTYIGSAFAMGLGETSCVSCGQCIAVCPTGAIYEKDYTSQIFDALADPEKYVIVQTAPAVRAALGEAFGLPIGTDVEGKLAAALRRLGFDKVFDTNFSADLTIMEEANEFLERLNHKEDYAWPMFTSCCPGWVRFLKSQYPDMTPQLSTAKSPQQMFGAVAKSYYADLLGVEPERIFSVSIMPCTAKKAEADLPVMNDAGAGQDVDVVLTTREVDRFLRAKHILPKIVGEEEFDTPLGVGTGAAVIFGVTGGVMEAALRSAYNFVTGENPDPDSFAAVRGRDGIREVTVEIKGIPVRAAIASGLGNARKLVEAIRSGQAEYDFVEIMACPGGCAGGGGQPICDGVELGEVRGEKLYCLDQEASLRFSHENPSIIRIYEDYLEKPLSHRAHELLHTDHDAWEMPRQR